MLLDIWRGYLQLLISSHLFNTSCTESEKQYNPRNNMKKYDQVGVMYSKNILKLVRKLRIPRKFQQV